ncbi:hypothetical protein I79_018737 [Cricetulus griseus]|uniref:Uncharacterized protein n=1 Tax=Cricetulus griseus TaxID=10029 RepID=G3I5I8_CRIGR|nr:hypothetical protein I79_018737 [Cricetulus griseus]
MAQWKFCVILSFCTLIPELNALEAREHLLFSEFLLFSYFNAAWVTCCCEQALTHAAVPVQAQ